MTPLSKQHVLMRIFRGALVDLPSPSSLQSWWNFGSLLGLSLVIQLLSGLFLSMHYVSDMGCAFESISHISRDVNFGWLLRMIHANGASLFFVCLYLHLGRNLYYMSFKFVETWSVGVVLLVLTMATAFLGYVLPWGQMSFWGATVITNLFSAIPVVGPELVEWLWGGFAVSQATLTRFFSFHFMIPFLITGISGVHLLFLHQHGSNNPLGLSLNQDKIAFYPYFFLKDIVGYLFVMLVFGGVVFLFPWMLGDPENFIPANPMVTPVHIQPEWYFLFAYAILRSIPNKLGGVVALGLSVLILFSCPYMGSSNMQGFVFYYYNKILFWMFVVVVMLLTWIGACPVEHPYVITGQVLTVLYFSYYMIFSVILKLADSVMK